MTIVKRFALNSLVLLSLAQFGKFFSHFGMRTLFILYLVEHLYYLEEEALCINALLFALIELGGVFGGVLADRYLGLQRALLVGACFLALGYLSLLVEGGLFLFMGLLTTGGSFFSGNIMALVGNYEKKQGKEGAFSFFYVAQNAGALVATTLCSILALRYGFFVAFAASASGMLVSCTLLFLYKKQIKGLENSLEKKAGRLFSLGLFSVIFFASLAIFYEKGFFLPLLPYITISIFFFYILCLFKELAHREIRRLVFYLSALIVFFAVEDQICSSLILFSESVDHHIFGTEVPSSLIMTLNPVVILIFGSLLRKKRGSLVIPFYLSAVGFGGLFLFCLFSVKFLFLGAVGATIVLSFSEVLLGPFIFSGIAKVTGKKNTGMIMGLIPIAFSLAFQLSGVLSKMIVVGTEGGSLHVYGLGFGKVALLLLGGGVLFHCTQIRIKDSHLSFT